MLDNLICGGCSFTADGIGGSPPTRNYQGNSLFKNYGPEFRPSTPNAWSSFVASFGQFNSFVNVAASGHGNILTVTTIMFLLNKFNYMTENSVILFNITDPDRYDICSDFNNDMISENIPWNRNLIDFGFLDVNYSKNFRPRQIDFEPTGYNTSAILQTFFSFLTNKKFNFYFLMMQDYFSIETPLRYWLPSYENNLIKLDGVNNMYDYCIFNDFTVSDDNFHPNENGHCEIGKIVFEKIVS